MMTRKPMMAGNWKMYKTVPEAIQFLTAFETHLKTLSGRPLPDVVLCAPFTVLYAMQQFLESHPTPVHLGAQNMDSHDEGAFTGEIAPRMLTDLAVHAVIVGHSERRTYYHETDRVVRQKVEAALENHLTPIVCVGESLAHRERCETDTWIEDQVMAALESLPFEKREQLIFAYEPIWAIGTGKVCDANEANRVVALIRTWTGVPELRVLYGGSMKPDNVESLMQQPAIDGGLVGGASLEADSFFKLVRAAMPAEVSV